MVEEPGGFGMSSPIGRVERIGCAKDGVDMTRVRTRLTAGASAALLALLAAAGCTSGGTPGPHSSAAETASGDPAALSAVAAAMNKADAAGTVTMTGTTSSGTDGTATLTGQVEFSPVSELSMTSRLESESLSTIYVGTSVYLNYPALSGVLGGKPWAEIDLSKASALGALSPIPLSTVTYNPVTSIAALVASGAVTEVGTASVDGQQTTHYRGTLTTSQLSQQTGSATRLTAAQLSALTQVLQQSGTSSETVDLWIGTNGLPVEVKSVAQALIGATTSDLHLSGWGQAVKIGVPPSSEVYDMTKQLTSAAASASASR